MIGDYLNVVEAASIIGCSPGRVRQLLRAAEMRGVKANEKAWLIPRKEAERMAKHKPNTGRPRRGKK